MNMSCDQIRQQFLARDWDRSALDEAVKIVEHLRECSGCREAADDYDRLRHWLRPAEPVPDFPAGGLERGGLLPTVQPRRRRTLPWAWAAAVAASLLIGLTGWVMYLHMPSPAREVAQPQPRPAGEPMPKTQDPRPENQPAYQHAVQWTHADVERDVQVFTNVSEAFQGRTSWVAMGDHAAELGLMPTTGRGHKVLLLRLVMTQGDQPRSKVDLVIVPGQDASLNVPFEAGQVLGYHIATTAGANRRLSLWAELRTPNGNGETLAALATQFQPVPGQSLSAGRMVTSSGGYNLEISFQEKEFSEGKP
jgi:predicted anti-sigma-YlaC factor YlaD